MIYSAAGLWKDFDADKLEFDTAVISDKTDDCGLTKKWVYFNGRKTESGEYVRILALIVHKNGKSKLPALVLVPASGQPVNEGYAVYWAKKGYAVIAVDNAGESGSAKHTIYPKEINYANYKYSGRYLTHCDFTAKQTCWYEWAVNARRAISFISQEPFAANEKVMLLSEGDGSIIACMLGAFDKRVKACAVLAGSCWLDTDGGNDADLEERVRWAAGIAPQSYMMFMNAPFYISSGTNSNEADINRTNKTLLTVPEGVPKAMLFVPGVAVSGDERFLTNINKWFSFVKDKKQCPKFPTAEFEIKDRKLFVKVTAEIGEPVETVKIFFARECGNARARYWVEKEAEALGENKFCAQGEVVAGGGAAYCFCNVTLKNGFALSSNIAVIKEDKLEGAVDFASSSKLVFKGSSGEMPFTLCNLEKQDDRKTWEKKTPEIKTGPFEISGAAGVTLSTFALNSPKYVKEDGSILTFDVYSENEQELKVYYVKNFASSEQSVFEMKIALLGGYMWQKVNISPQDFHSVADRSPDDWKECQLLSFAAEEEIILNNLLFT